MVSNNRVIFFFLYNHAVLEKKIMNTEIDKILTKLWNGLFNIILILTEHLRIFQSSITIFKTNLINYVLITNVFWCPISGISGKLKNNLVIDWNLRIIFQENGGKRLHKWKSIPAKTIH